MHSVTKWLPPPLKTLIIIGYTIPCFFPFGSGLWPPIRPLIEFQYFYSRITTITWLLWCNPWMNHFSEGHEESISIKSALKKHYSWLITFFRNFYVAWAGGIRFWLSPSQLLRCRYFSFIYTVLYAWWAWNNGLLIWGFYAFFHRSLSNLHNQYVIFL